MKKNPTLGEVLRRKREILGMTQRELSRQLGVKSSHVTYLESDRRRPSLGLLSRIADVLHLEREPLFVLAHPEASSFVATVANRPTSPDEDARKVWQDFAGNKALIAQHRINPAELRVLSQISLLGRVTAPRNFLFILNAIRQAVDDE
jgi:transcriptional regulator with XRE-family HTH domain